MDPAPKYDPRYLRGIEAFNRGDHFEAHEVWENLWRDCPAGDRRFYQSLIQAAVSLYHAGRGNPAGANRLLAAGRDKMAGYPPAHLGLDAAGFWRAVEAAVADLLCGRPPADPPRILLSPATESRHER